MAPVGIVAAIFIKTIMKKKSASTPASSRPPRKKPLVPHSPKRAWSAVPPMPNPWFNSSSPRPSEERQPGPTGLPAQFPQPRANP